MGERNRNENTGAIILFLVLWLAKVNVVSGLQTSVGSRRDFVAALATATGTLVAPDASISQVSGTPNDESLSSQLLSLIPAMEAGAPATNLTLPSDVSSEIERLVSTMEKTTTTSKNAVQSPLLSGSWRLLYSNAPEIVGLAKGLPLGFRLGPTYQPLDPTQGYFENTARLDHPNQLATLRTIVVGTIAPSPKGSLNAVGVVNDMNNRVDVRFDVIVFELDELLGNPLKIPLRKTLVPKPLSEGTAPPANDQTYLDAKVRIVRGGDGSLFVFTREAFPGESPMSLTAQERADILASSGSTTATTLVSGDLESEIRNTKNSDKIPIEIQYLFREQR